ncbi:DUF4386 domain-containing protein [Bacillus spongiae]|uniref:DUF4386 domain-containing protein n=1 Tax=Bacillus spongiae TaxID=2683610 RepID=A0ABU8HG50_9BACI
MKFLQEDTNFLRHSAIIAGVSLLIMTLAAFFSYGYVHSSLINPDNPLATLNNIEASAHLFKAGIFGWFVILITDILVSWAFYLFLKPLHKGFAVLAAWLRLMYTAILAIALSNLLQVVELVSYRGELFNESQITLASQVFMSIRTFESTWAFGLIVFGMHLLIVGIVVINTKTVPKVISILLIAGGVSYILIQLLIVFFPTFDNVITILEIILSIPMTIGELGFGVWLLIKGGKTPFRH